MLNYSKLELAELPLFIYKDNKELGIINSKISTIAKKIKNNEAFVAELKDFFQISALRLDRFEQQYAENRSKLLDAVKTVTFDVRKVIDEIFEEIPLSDTEIQQFKMYRFCSDFIHVLKTEYGNFVFDILDNLLKLNICDLHNEPFESFIFDSMSDLCEHFLTIAKSSDFDETVRTWQNFIYKFSVTNEQIERRNNAIMPFWDAISDSSVWNLILQYIKEHNSQEKYLSVISYLLLITRGSSKRILLDIVRDELSNDNAELKISDYLKSLSSCIYDDGDDYEDIVSELLETIDDRCRKLERSLKKSHKANSES